MSLDYEGNKAQNAITQALHTSSDYLLYGNNNFSDSNTSFSTTSTENLIQKNSNFPTPDPFNMLIDHLPPQKAGLSYSAYHSNHLSFQPSPFRQKQQQTSHSDAGICVKHISTL